MTCREKLKLEHPEYIDTTYDGGCKACPHTYGYLPPPRVDICCTLSCSECWDREIPETNIKKENDIMPTHAINVNTKRTKAELVEEIKLAHEHIQKMENQSKNLARYKQYEDMANELRAMQLAFMNSGFSDEQAYDLLKTMTQAVVPTALRGMGL